MLHHRNINQLQQILLMRKIVAYLVVLKYVQLFKTIAENQSVNLIEEADENGQVNADYIYLGSIPIARVDEWWEGMETPEAPTGVTVIPGDKQLTVSWNANQAPVDGYKVYWGTESRNYTNSVDVEKVTTYTITRLTNGTPYYIAVTAYRDIEEIYYYHTDHLGTPIMMTDKNQNVAWEGEFMPFGEPLTITGTVTNNLRFPGQYFDEETELYYNWHRHYKAEIGRYIEKDPIGLKGGVNPYIYVKNRPIKLVDPLGLDSAGNLYFYAAGVWREDTVFEADLGQVVTIKVKNVNILGTTISIGARPSNQSEQLILLPQVSHEFRFSTFSCEPIHWKFDVSTQSDAFIVNYEIKSTWIPGMPPR